MKSIVEEGSSVFKAIEKGWTRAGQPTHFSVKIFELPEKNFFGMTTKQAKVGIMFDQEAESGRGQKTPSSVHKKAPNKQAPVPPKKHPNQADRPAERQERQEQRSTQSSSAQERPDRQDKAAKPQPPREPRKNNEPRKERDRRDRPAPLKEGENAESIDLIPVGLHEAGAPVVDQAPQQSSWTDELVSIMQTLIKESLAMLGLPNIEFSHVIDQGVLKVTFNAPVLDNPVKEKQFFQHYAFLLIALLRNQSKVNFRSLRLFLASERDQEV